MRMGGCTINQIIQPLFPQGLGHLLLWAEVGLGKQLHLRPTTQSHLSSICCSASSDSSALI